MVVISGSIGSSNYAWFHGSKADCEAWLMTRKTVCERAHEGLWANVYYPIQWLSDRDARKAKYRDGNYVFGQREFGKFVFQSVGD